MKTDNDTNMPLSWTVLPPWNPSTGEVLPGDSRVQTQFLLLSKPEASLGFLRPPSQSSPSKGGEKTSVRTRQLKGKAAGKLRSRTMRALESSEMTACKCHQNRGVNPAKGSAKTGEVTFKESPGWQACTKQSNLYSLQYLNSFFKFFQLTILSISLKVMETLMASWSTEWNKGWSKKEPKAGRDGVHL